MVRNTKGGNKGKKGARRHNNNTDRSNKIRLKDETNEIYGKIVQMHGNGAAIKCDDGIRRFLVWRNKFKGRNKRDNLIKVNGIVLAGKRQWEVVGPKKIPKADLLFVYSKDHESYLYKNHIIPKQLYADEYQSDIIFDKGVGVVDNDIEDVKTGAPENNIIDNGLLEDLIDDI